MTKPVYALKEVGVFSLFAAAPCLAFFEAGWTPDLLMLFRVTQLTPSTNFVLNKTSALLNMPSFKDTTMNCECGKCGDFKKRTFIFRVCFQQHICNFNNAYLLFRFMMEMRSSPNHCSPIY